MSELTNKDRFNKLMIDSIAEISTPNAKSNQNEKRQRERIRNISRKKISLSDRYQNALQSRGQTFEDRIIKKQILTRLPESYLAMQKQIAFDEGAGEIELDNEQIQNLLNIAKINQTESIKPWFNYILSKDNDYPDWYRYLVIKNVVKTNREGKRRSRDTVDEFIPLDAAAVALVYDQMNLLSTSNKINSSDINFTKLYLKELKNRELFKTDFTKEEIAQGSWKVFKQSNFEDDAKSLSTFVKHTNWCTAGVETARMQLSNGDFYVYEIGGIPSVAIRMENENVREVRGTKENQNLSDGLSEKVQEKLQTLPGGNEYKNKVEDMKRLTDILSMSKKGENLAVEDLRFVYEVDKKIEGFGYETDPRIAYILASRNHKKDLANIFECSEDDVRTNDNEKLSKNHTYKVWCGNLFYDWNADQGFKFPEVVLGSFFATKLKEIDKVTFPKIICGDLKLHSAISITNSILPEKVMGTIELNSLPSLNNIKLPAEYEGIQMNELKQLKDYTFPDCVQYIEISSLEEATNVIFPRTYNDHLSLNLVKKLVQVTFPHSFVGDLMLENLEFCNTVAFPTSLNGSLTILQLKNYTNSIFPENMNGAFVIPSLKKLDTLIIPNQTYHVLLEDLESISEKLIFPEYYDGDIILTKLKNISKVVLPKEFHGTLHIQGLEDFDGIKFPDPNLSDGVIMMANISEDIQDKLLNQYPHIRFRYSALHS